MSMFRKPQPFINGPPCDLGQRFPELKSCTEFIENKLYFASMPNAPKDPEILAECSFFNTDNDLVIKSTI